MRVLDVITPGLHMQFGRRLDPYIDVFRKALDNSMSFGKRGAAFQFEFEPMLLQPVEAVHDPVVLLHQRGRNPFFVSDDTDEVSKLRMIVKIVGGHGAHVA
jgi:hypothetical protein